jgi:hypothetical protein
MTPEERLKAKREQEAEIRARLKQEKSEKEVKKLEEQLKKIQKGELKEKQEQPDASLRPSPRYIPHDKFIHLTKGVTEAEVLSRFGEPTRIVEDKPTVVGGTVTGVVSPRGTVTGTVSGGRIIEVKRYYYIGDKNKGEKTTIIHFRRGKVVKYERI